MPERGKRMTYPPGQGRSGEHLMQLWRGYLEQYADNEGDVEAQTVVAANHTVEILTSLSRILDRNNRYRELIDQRLDIFREAGKRAQVFEDRLLNAAFSLYNSLNTLGHQFTEGNIEASSLLQRVDEQVHRSIQSAGSSGRSAAALRACFPLVSLIAITLDQKQAMTNAIRHVERRFASGAEAAGSDWEHAWNALYRIVEMMQILTVMTDTGLTDQIHQIASRFQEEDRNQELRVKLRNGFCRFFELSHLLATQVDAMV
jgi:hypothetical protein